VDILRKSRWDELSKNLRFRIGRGIGFGARSKAIEVNRPYLTNLTTLACTATARLAIMWYAFSDV
jgi:hypothetical protein